MNKKATIIILLFFVMLFIGLGFMFLKFKNAPKILGENENIKVPVAAIKISVGIKLDESYINYALVNKELLASESLNINDIIYDSSKLYGKTVKKTISKGSYFYVSQIE